MQDSWDTSLFHFLLGKNIEFIFPCTVWNVSYTNFFFNYFLCIFFNDCLWDTEHINKGNGNGKLNYRKLKMSV